MTVAHTMVGASPKPRQLPPDGARKVIQHWNVEDLFFIPSGPLVDVSSTQMRHVLGADAAVGCPHYRAPIEEMFCYRPGPRWPFGVET